MVCGSRGLCGANAALPVAMEASQENVCVMGHAMEVRSVLGEIQNAVSATPVNVFQVCL